MDESHSFRGKVKEAQQLRLQRLSMAVATYGVVILATFLVTRLGLGRLSIIQWGIYIGSAVLINGILFLLFRSGLNLRFSDPSLTREQLVLSSLWGMLALYCLPQARPIVLMFFLPAFSFGMLRLNRRSYFIGVAWIMGFYAALLIIEYFQNRPGFQIEYEFFLYAIFGIILIWFAFFGGFVSDIRKRLKERNRQIHAAHEKITQEMEERRQVEKEKDDLIKELRDALDRIETLSGLLPICASCKKIRDDKGYWNQIEAFVRDHSKAEFSHSICPECAKKLFPGVTTEKK